MNKFFVSFLLFFSLLLGEVDWSNEQIIVLKANESHKMKLLVGVNDVREFAFHWTLFVGGDLVFLAKYDSFNHHMILRQDYKRNSMRLDLSKEGRRGGISPFVVVFFQSYDEKNKTATFKVVTYGDVFIQ